MGLKLREYIGSRVCSTVLKYGFKDGRPEQTPTIVGPLNPDLKDKEWFPRKTETNQQLNQNH